MVVYNQHNSPGVAPRLWEKVDRTGDCWIWTHGLSLGGRYGALRVDGRMQAAHRVSYEMARGPIPAGLELDHLCRNTRCVRPDHLEPVTHAENMSRGIQAATVRNRRGRCARHDEPMSRASGSWVCRSCRRQANRDYRARKKAAA